MSINKSPPNFLTLTDEEVQRLLEDGSSATRIDMTAKIAGAYEHKRLNPKEIAAAEQVFRLLLRDTELRVRVALAQHVKASDIIPRDIVMTLAKDVEEVSLPVLQFSEVLDDNDLLELIRGTQDVSRYIAISKRKQVSEAVAGTLLEKGDKNVAVALVENKGAQISEEGFSCIINAYRDNHALMHAVGHHPRLPAVTAEKLISAVSASLAETLKRRYSLPAEQIQAEAEKTRESETLGLVRQSQSQDEIDRLIVQLRAYNRLTPSIILSALCQGHFAFFETSLAMLAHIPVSNARMLISDRGDLGFRAIYNKAGLPDPMFGAVKLLLRVVRELDSVGEKPGSSRYANMVVESLLKHAEDMPVDNLSYIIALVRKVG